MREDPRRDRRLSRRRPATLTSAAAIAAVVAFAGCGDDAGGGRTGGGAGPGGGASGELVAALGDSITSGSPGYDPDPAAAAALGFGSDERSQYEYWAQRAHPEIAFRNCGVFGERTDQIAIRLRDCADGADALIVQGGINDIAQSLGGGRAAIRAAVRRAAINLESMLGAAQRLGVPAAVTDVLPWNNGHPAADRAIDELNARIARLAGAREVPVLYFHDTLEDPRRAGRMKPRLSADGDHPSVAGYRLLGERAFEVPRD